MSSNEQTTSAPIVKHEVTPLMKRRLMTAISDHFATKHTYADDTLFYADLGKLHAQLSGDLEFQLKDFKTIATTVHYDEKPEATTTAYFTAPIRLMREGKWILNRALDLDYLPQSRRMIDGSIRYSVPRISQRVAQQVFNEHKDVFLKLEFLNDINQATRTEKKSRKTKEIIDVFEHVGPALPDFPVTEEDTHIEETVTDQEIAELFEEPQILEDSAPESQQEIIQTDEEEELHQVVSTEHEEEIANDDLSGLLDI